MNAKRAQHLFDTDTRRSVFSAWFCDFRRFDDDDPAFRAVNLYPRKSRRGFIYCIWKPGVSEIGLDAIVDGGITRSKSFDRAVLEATAALLRHHRDQEQPR